MSGVIALANYNNRSEKELALWMLERMRDSEEFLDVIQTARVAGRPDVLDSPEYVTRHKDRLKKLYQSDDEEVFDAPPALAAKIKAIMQRDMISSVEELLERALTAYITLHPEKAASLPKNWATTFDLARAEIEGKSNGAFASGFAATLAASGRAELDRAAAAELTRDADRGGRED